MKALPVLSDRLPIRWLGAVLISVDEARTLQDALPEGLAFVRHLREAIDEAVARAAHLNELDNRGSAWR